MFLRYLQPEGYILTYKLRCCNYHFYDAVLVLCKHCKTSKANTRELMFTDAGLETMGKSKKGNTNMNVETKKFQRITLLKSCLLRVLCF